MSTFSDPAAEVRALQNIGVIQENESHPEGQPRRSKRKMLEKENSATASRRRISDLAAVTKLVAREVCDT